MSKKQCPKCHHVTEVEGAAPLACPSCGAIYSKVEAALEAGAPVRPALVGKSPTSTLNEPPFPGAAPAQAASKVARGSEGSRFADSGHGYVVNHEPFIATLRRESIYPNFRAVVRFGYWLAIIVAAIGVLGALLSRNGVAIVTSLVGGAFVVIMVSFLRESTLMLADMSDATIRMAERQERQSRITS